MLIVLKTDYFQLGLVHKSDLRIFTARKHLEVIRIKHFKLKKTDNQIYVFKGTILNPALLLRFQTVK